MSNVDSAGAAAQQAIFDKLGINTNKTAEQRASSDKLGQDDFLQLMTAQLQNQDPFAPMENGDFIAQMAQFSTVSGIEEINKNLSALSADMRQARIATASTLLGHSVLVPGGLARPDSNGEIHGVFELPQAASAMAALLGWDEARQTAEIQNCRDIDRDSRAGFTTGTSYSGDADDVRAAG